MQIDRFQQSPTGRLVPITVEEAGDEVDHFAFVPSPLPVDLDLTPKTWGAAIDAAHHLGRLDALAKELLPNPMLVARPTIRREAVSTSALEGTFAPAADVLSSEIDADIPRSHAVTEVLNFIHATEQGIERLNELPISTRLACELQRTLIAGTPSEDWQTGKVRQTQVLIGPYKGCSVLEATYIPPPPGDELGTGMSDWRSGSTTRPISIRSSASLRRTTNSRRFTPSPTGTVASGGSSRSSSSWTTGSSASR